MKYKMIVTDMDDTLLRDDHTVSERTKNAIEKAQQMGVKFVLASGRPTFAMREFADQFKLAEYESYILSYNGAVITCMKRNEEIHRDMLSSEEVHELVEHSKEHDVYIHTYLGDDIVTDENNKYTDIEQDITGMEIKEVDCLKETVQEDVVKVLMLEDPEHLKGVAAKLKEKFDEQYSITISKPYFLEFMPKGVHKGSGIDKLAKTLGIKAEEIIAIGDSFNDMEMLEYAGLGVCVENAKPEVKEVADVIVASNMQDGVAEVIEKFILNEDAK